MKEKVLITGGAGFIGFHLIKRLISEGVEVIAIDNLNSYYSVELKNARLENLYKLKGIFKFHLGDIEDYNFLKEIFEKYEPKIVVNLAAQAGVRYSIDNPSIFVKSNIVGFGNLLEISRKHNIKHLVYASSSSVYGGNYQLPYSEKNNVDHPVSIYAASKKSNELMAHAYSHLYSLPATGLRFFTVYGPWGRPDMALFLFTKAISEGKKIDVFNYGDMTRDFTYIDDVIESLRRVINKPPISMETKNSDKKTNNKVPHKVFNVGNSDPKTLMEYIKLIEKCLGKEAKKNYLPIQPGDVPITYADTSKLEDWIGFKPNTSLEKGIDSFVKWYKKYYGLL